MNKVEDTIRVLRILEYTGPRSLIESTVSRSIQGEKNFGATGRECTIRAATIGMYPEILNNGSQETVPNGEQK